MLFRPKSNKRFTDAESFHQPVAPIANKASEVIRNAERLIQGREYDKALEKLDAAQKLDPQNQYIMAIIDRIHVLQKNPNAFVVPVELSGEERAQLRTLTDSAKRSMKKGNVQDAFDSLMDAYLIDPVNPAVLALEETVIPAWEKSRVKSGKSLNATEMMGAFSKLDSVDSDMSAPAINIYSLHDSLKSVPGSPDEHLPSIEKQKQQEEAERFRRELSLWRRVNRTGL
ncbi:MAG TPA: hypothetical protein VGB89_05000 [Bacteroidota bacterium]